MLTLSRSKDLPGHGPRIGRNARRLRLVARARICELHPEADFGCLCTSDGRELYFHRNCVSGGGFDGLHTGDAVRFVERLDDPGLHASRVLPADGPLAPPPDRATT